MGRDAHPPPDAEGMSAIAGLTDDRIDLILPIQSDAQLYRQAGNGVTVNVVEAIGKRLAACH